MLVAAIDFELTDRRRNAFCCVVIFAGIVVHSPLSALGAPDSTSPDQRQSSENIGNSHQPPKQKESESDADSQQQKQKLKAALYVVGGIAFVGVVAILGVVLWGIRVRRGTRIESKPNTPLDPLWYLKQGAAAKTGLQGRNDTNLTTDQDDGGEDAAESS